VDADTGALVWSSALLGDAIQAGVSGTLTQLGFSYDSLMVGSRNASGGNSFFGLDPIDGTTVWTFDNGGGASGIGIISGAAAVDASTNRVYFGSRALAGGSSGTLWCLTFSDTTSSLCNASWPLSLGDIDGSPVLAGGRLYVGTNGGTVYSLDPTSGATIWSVALGDGSIKDYVWPQFGANYFYVSTGTKVWSLSDSGTSTPTMNWSFSIAGPSTPYYDAGTGSLFVGSTDGKLHQLSSLQLATPVELTEVIGAGTAVVGSPAMDASGLLDVGTESGAVYSVTIPLSSASPGKVVISQVYGGGGNTGATYKNDFIELFNAGGTAVSLSGWSVQYASATGNTWQTTSLTNVSLNPGQYYLIQEAAGAGGTTALPTPDASGNIAMSATAGKVALVNSTTPFTVICPTGATIIDFVGFGTTANCFEGAGPTPAPSNTNAVLRKSGGCQDTNVNSADFAAGAPTPRNTSTTVAACP
jgi:outer membrane protein assembly factor BamB